MSIETQAKIILDHLDTVIHVNWDMEEYYLQAIEGGLAEIETLEMWEENTIT